MVIVCGLSVRSMILLLVADCTLFNWLGLVMMRAGICGRIDCDVGCGAGI